jgi:hypothetical protein
MRPLEGDALGRSGSKQGRRLHGFLSANRLDLLKFHLDVEIGMGQGGVAEKQGVESPHRLPLLWEGRCAFDQNQTSKTVIVLTAPLMTPRGMPLPCVIVSGHAFFSTPNPKGKACPSRSL